MEKIVDMFGNELKVGDTICFTLSMRKDQKPIVCATIADFKPDNTEFGLANNNAWIILGEYRNNPTYSWAKNEGKLIAKVSSHRVVKCY